MILAYWGQRKSETEIAQLLGTDVVGTPISNIEKLKRWGFKVDFGSLTIEALENQLIAGRPIIARVWTPMLDYWTIDTSHVVVVTGFDEEHIYLNDPAVSEFPKKVLRAGFLAAWAEFDETAAVIYPP